MEAGITGIELSEINRLARENDIVSRSYREYMARVEAVADHILAEDSRLVLVAGPSSSGKTTSSQLISRSLRQRGKNSAVISMDMFFRHHDTFSAKREDGTADYEHVDAVNLEALRETVTKLIEGKPSSITLWNLFRQREEMADFDPGPGDLIVVIEGLHALDPLTWQGLPEQRMTKVYATIFNEVTKDGEEYLSASDIRISRRLLRDRVSRGGPVERTLGIQDSIEEGADRWVRPFREHADCLLNTTFLCEFGMLKGEILKCCADPAQGGKFRQKLLELGEKFRAFEDTDIGLLPKDAVIREFLGGLEL